MPYVMLVVVAGAVALVFFASAVTFGLGTIAGAVAAIAMACATLVGRGHRRPVLVLPRHVVEGTAGLPRRRDRTPFRRDRAWPGYLVSQWRNDWTFFRDGCRSFIQVGYQRIGVWQADFEASPMHTLVVAVPIAGWTGVAAGMLAGAVVLTAGCGIALVLAALGWGSVIGVLRGYDGTVRRARRADAVCPHPQCYYKQHVPSYRCKSCREVHRDIRPGLLGAVWRRCGCGTKLPTTVLRAARYLTALCERCGAPLRTGSAAVTGIVVPVFGPVSAGKSRLVRSGLVRLHDELAAAGAELDFEDEASRQVFDDGTRLMTGGGNTVKTSAGQLPAAITAQVRRGRRRAQLNLFDAAGELFADREDSAELEFLDHARGMVFVVDPFSIPWVHDQLGGPQDELVLAAQPAVSEPEDVYQVTVRRLKDYHLRLDRRTLAVVVVKADLLDGHAWADPLLSGDIRRWLLTAGQENLVLSAERDFAKTRFFVTSSVTGNLAGAVSSPAEPFRWLMSRSGFPIRRRGVARKREEKV